MATDSLSLEIYSPQNGLISSQNTVKSDIFADTLVIVDIVGQTLYNPLILCFILDF